jgi:hydroxymethylglutaryl-CoA reductase (NADPH)
MDEIRDRPRPRPAWPSCLYIDPYLANKFAYLRFNFTTGDAAGQNMVGRATFAACSWILDSTTRAPLLPGVEPRHRQEGQPGQRHAHARQARHRRGVIPRDVLIQHMRVEPEQLFYHFNVANVGAILSGANNNGAPLANGITAMFIATGQDVANVAESSAGISTAS